MQPDISVVMPVHNRSLLLKEAVHSLLTQTLSNWEAIIVDDYSTENIAQVISELDDSRVKYFRNPSKKGIGSSRNFGNKMASAPLIAVADSDDLCLPRRLEVSVNYFKAHPECDLFYSNLYILEDGSYNIRSYKYFAPYQREALYEGQFIPHGTVTYKKESILAHPYDEELPYTVDYDMLLTFADHNRNFGYTEEPLYLWRHHTQERVSIKKIEDMSNNKIIPIKERHIMYKLSPISHE